MIVLPFVLMIMIKTTNNLSVHDLVRKSSLNQRCHHPKLFEIFVWFLGLLGA
jgi:hypothetical protein